MMTGQISSPRGSRTHVLDWLERPDGDFPNSLAALLQPTGAVIDPTGPWLPLGTASPAEALLDRPGGPQLLPPEVRTRLRRWWLAVDHPKASGPNWDLAAAATFPGNRRGLVLIEAKAHVGELCCDGKRSDPTTNAANHLRIGGAIVEASQALDGVVAGVRLSHQSHYQFANRVAFAWKLAREGIPTALIYLGFSGDETIGKLSSSIRNSAHWRAVMAAHTRHVLPPAIWERDIGTNGVPLWLLMRSRPVLRHSPAAAGRKASARRPASLAAAPGPPPTSTPDLASRARARGCLLGGAVGDALGAPVEFLSIAEIRNRFGQSGIRDFAPAYGRVGAITDDTQMTLFTAEGLLRGWVRGALKGICHPPSVIHHAYFRWHLTQGAAPDALHEEIGREIGRDGWLFGIAALHARRAPGATCLAALRAATGLGQPPVAHNDSKGCGGVMRVAPVGLFAGLVGNDDAVFGLATDAAALTHGHPSGFLAAGFLAVAIAVCCALAARDFADGACLAVNHSSDSDSTGAIAGNLLGALLGEAAIPASWLARLELRDEITALADDLHAAATNALDPEAAWDRYPGW